MFSMSPIRTRMIGHVVVFVMHTYFFWALFSLVNFKMLAPLALLPVFPLVLPMLRQILTMEMLATPFLLGVAVSLLVACVALSLQRVRDNRELGIGLAWLCNAVFLTVFLGAGEQLKNRAIAEQLAHRHPDCVEINSFFSAITEAGKEFRLETHALFTEDGKTFYWSYWAASFLEGNENLRRNFPCIPRKGDQTGSRR